MESEKSKISIIIPAYNAAKFIGQAIESIFRQTLPPLEIIVIDDASTDQTVSLVEKYSSPVRLLKQKKSGVSAARNFGIRESIGEFVAFLDADDIFIEPTKLEKQLALIKEKDCDLVMSGWRITDENLNKIADRPLWLEVPQINLFHLIRTVAVLPSAMFVRRSKLLEIDGFDKSLTNAEDVDLVFRLLLANCQAEWLKEITVAYRKHPANATNQIRCQNDGIKKVFEKLFLRSDLPVSIRQIESEIRYHSLIWLAYDCFLAGDLTEMKRYLLDSREFAKFSQEGLLMDWFYSFERFAADQGKVTFNAHKLLFSDEWDEFQKTLSL
ncbi:MAG: glycosyltransferase [Pyrinomonadaceae bacterium]|nr:glycosyltransferase [Pyrinomonadaceae bacterium]